MSNKKTITVQGIMTILVLTTFMCFYMSYEKYEATWYGINVTIISLLFGVPLALIMKKYLDNYFRYRFISFASMKAFTIMSVGVCLFLLSGIYFTEPDSNWKQAEVNNNQNTVYVHHYHHNDGYNYSRSGRYINNNSFNAVNFIPEGSSSEDSGEGSEGAGLLILIAIVVLLIIASGVVIHFWVFACIFMLSLMGIYLYSNYKNSIFTSQKKHKL